MPPRIANLYAVGSLATIGGLIQGIDIASMSAILGTSQYKTYFDNPDAVTAGGITASLAGGCLVGTLFSSWTGDRIGRRDSMFCGCAVFLVGSTLMCAAQNRAMLIVSRVVNGFAAGILTTQGPVYIAEISPAHLRGRLIALQQWMVTWGILTMYFVSYGTSHMASYASFRLPWSLQMVPAAVLMICLPLMPRSPRWLASRGRSDVALEMLAILRAKGNRLDPQVVAEMRLIEERVELQSQWALTSWAEVVSAKNIVRVHCAIFAHIWAQYSGVNALIYYIVYIFQMAGLTGESALVSASIQYVINVVMTVPALMFVDSFPRRKVMMVGSFLMAVWLYTTGAVMATRGHAVPGGLYGTPTVTWVVPDATASKVIIACSYLYIATYACTWGPLGWIYPPETIPLHIRSKSIALATFSNWACNFSLTFFIPPAFQNIQWRVYMIFGTFCVAALIHVFLFFQETCAKPLEQMDEIFDNNVWAFGKIKGPPRTPDRGEDAENGTKTESEMVTHTGAVA